METDFPPLAAIISWFDCGNIAQPHPTFFLLIKIDYTSHAVYGRMGSKVPNVVDASFNGRKRLCPDV